MMYKLLMLSIVQSALLSIGQVVLKLALQQMGTFEWSRSFFVAQLTNWWFLATGICYGFASVLWLYILKNFPFSMADPMVSLSYVFGMIAAILVFHETVPLTRWIGVCLIMGGCVLVAR